MVNPLMPWAILILAVTVGLLALRLGRTEATSQARAGELRRVANSAPFLRSPLVQRRIVRRRLLNVALLVLTIGGLITSGVLVGRPVEVSVRSEKLASRDIVLCLDVSTSVLTVDVEVLKAFHKLLDSFNGERVALVAWNQTAQTIVPLTDDYDLLREQFDEATKALDFNPVWPSQEDERLYLDTFGGTLTKSVQGSSLAGDGLASCALVFDEKRAEDRSRSIVLATDNVVQDFYGDQIYTLNEAGDMVSERGIQLFALFGYDPELASGFGADSTEKEARQELKNVTEVHGGLFYEVADPEATGGIVRRLEQDQAQILDGDSRAVVTDVPERTVYTLLLLVVVLLALMAWRRA